MNRTCMNRKSGTVNKRLVDFIFYGNLKKTIESGSNKVQGGTSFRNRKLIKVTYFVNNFMYF